jgi:hypothetical protein
MKKIAISAIALAIANFTAVPASAGTETVLSQPTTAPTVAAPPVAPLTVGANAVQTKLASGTELSLRLRSELTTKDKILKVGDRFDLEAVDPLKIGSTTVVPAGTRAVGEITFVRNKGMWGKSGKFNARLLFLQMGDRNIRLAGTFDDKGTSGGWGAVGATLLSPVILPIGGFFVTGTSARLAAGTIVKAHLDEDVPVAITTASNEVTGAQSALPPVAAGQTGARQ